MWKMECGKTSRVAMHVLYGECFNGFKIDIFLSFFFVIPYSRELKKEDNETKDKKAFNILIL